MVLLHWLSLPLVVYYMIACRDQRLISRSESEVAGLIRFKTRMGLSLLQHPTSASSSVATCSRTSVVPEDGPLKPNFLLPPFICRHVNLQFLEIPGLLVSLCASFEVGPPSGLHQG